MRYDLDFGVSNAGGVPTWLYFERQDTGAALTPPAFVEVGSGTYYFDFSTPVTVRFKAILGGAEQFGVVTPPRLTAASGPTVVTSTSGATESGIFLEYTTDELVAQALDAGRIPDGAFTPAKLVTAASRALKSYLAPLLAATEQDFYSHDFDFTLSADGTSTYRVPSRAVAGSIREVSFLDASGSVLDVPRIALTDLEQAAWGFVLQGGRVRYVNRAGETRAVTLRMTVNVTPSFLCRAAEGAQILAIAGTEVTLGALPIPANPLLPAPDTSAPSSFYGLSLFDVLESAPGFDLAAMDVHGTCDGETLTLSEVPAGLEVGQLVAPARYSPVPQVPENLFALLAQRLAVDLLGQMGDAEGMKAAAEVMMRLEADAKRLVSNRTPGAPIELIPRGNLLDTTRRW